MQLSQEYKRKSIAFTTYVRKERLEINETSNQHKKSEKRQQNRPKKVEGRK